MVADSQGKVHRVSNPSHTEQLVTLHLYFPPLVECDVFDEATSHKSLGRMSYWSKDGKKLVSPHSLFTHCFGPVLSQARISRLLYLNHSSRIAESSVLILIKSHILLLTLTLIEVINKKLN